VVGGEFGQVGTKVGNFFFKTRQRTRRVFLLSQVNQFFFRSRQLGLDLATIKTACPANVKAGGGIDAGCFIAAIQGRKTSDYGFIKAGRASQKGSNGSRELGIVSDERLVGFGVKAEVSEELAADVGGRLHFGVFWRLVLSGVNRLSIKTQYNLKLYLSRDFKKIFEDFLTPKYQAFTNPVYGA
jgi:hypothetical protein